MLINYYLSEYKKNIFSHAFYCLSNEFNVSSSKLLVLNRDKRNEECAHQIFFSPKVLLQLDGIND